MSRARPPEAWYAGSHDPGGDRLVVTEVPYGVTLDEVVHGLAERVRAGEVDLRRSAAAPTRPPSDAIRRAPIADIRDESSADGGVRIICLLRPDAAPDEVRPWMLDGFPLRTTVEARLPAPISEVILSWDAGDGSGLSALSQVIAPHDTRRNDEAPGDSGE